jgi:para-aminobenzoate synthetase component 1
MIDIDFNSCKEARQKLLFAAKKFSEFFGTTLFLSGLEDSSSSYLCLLPYKKIQIEFGNPDPWGFLKKEMGEFKDQDSDFPSWFGYLSYEMGAFIEPHRIINHTPSLYPLALFLKSSVVLWQKEHRIVIQIKREFQNEILDPFENCSIFFEDSFWHHLFSSDEYLVMESIELFSKDEGETQESYIQKVKRAQEFIKAGDIYQVNLSRSVTFNTPSIPFSIFLRLAYKSAPNYSAFLNLNNFQIISISPEKFLSFEKGVIEARPIKGTLAKTNSLEENHLRKELLLSDPKEDAELMMICDLMRNDLGKISEIGTVKCVHKKKIISLHNLFHLESVIQSIPKPDHPLEYLRSCFPPGSITGCPKIRAMEIISLLEKRPRHIYCGSIGYFKPNGDFNFNVAIRTAVYSNVKLELQIGGAVTYDSDPLKEFEETEAKAASFYEILVQDAILSEKP